MRIESALIDWLHQEYKKPMISYQRLSLEIFKLYKNKKYKKNSISGIRKEFPEKNEFNRNISKLIELNSISRFEGKDNFFIVKAYIDRPYEEYICSIYEYGYLSYINAMLYYNITDRVHKDIHYTTLDSFSWRKLIIESLKINYPDIFRSKKKDYFQYFITPHPSIKKIFDRNVIIHTNKNNKVLDVKLTNSSIRVPKIGDLFLDIIRNPEYSGGMSHVIDTWKEYGDIFYKKIIKSVDVHGSNIDKARVGFMMEKVLHISDKRIEKWKKERGNTRGGSRKFLMKNNFSNIICYEWNISINCEELIDYV